MRPSGERVLDGEPDETGQNRANPSTLLVQREGLPESLNHFDESWRQPLAHGEDQGFRHVTVECLSDIQVRIAR
jgi:hypothetical protein